MSSFSRASSIPSIASLYRNNLAMPLPAADPITPLDSLKIRQTDPWNASHQPNPMSEHYVNVSYDMVPLSPHGGDDDVGTGSLMFISVKDQNIYNKKHIIMPIQEINYYLERTTRSNNDLYNRNVDHIKSKKMRDEGAADQHKYKYYAVDEPENFYNYFNFLGSVLRIDDNETSGKFKNETMLNKHGQDKRKVSICVQGKCEMRDIWNARAGDRLYLVVTYIKNPYVSFIGPRGQIEDSTPTTSDIMQIVPVKREPHYNTNENDQLSPLSDDINYLQTDIPKQKKFLYLSTTADDTIRFIPTELVNPPNEFHPKYPGPDDTDILIDSLKSGKAIYVGTAISTTRTQTLSSMQIEQALRNPISYRNLPKMLVSADI